MAAMGQKEDAAALSGAVAVTLDRERVSHFSVYSIPHSSAQCHYDATTRISSLHHLSSYGNLLGVLCFVSVLLRLCEAFRELELERLRIYSSTQRPYRATAL
jgi:hypothetical protein